MLREPWIGIVSNPAEAAESVFRRNREGWGKRKGKGNSQNIRVHVDEEEIQALIADEPAAVSALQSASSNYRALLVRLRRRAESLDSILTSDQSAECSGYAVSECQDNDGVLKQAAAVMSDSSGFFQAGVFLDQLFLAVAGKGDG